MTSRTPTRPSPTRQTSQTSRTSKPRPTPGRPAHAGGRRRRGLTRLDLSATQLMATAFAAVTATVAGSFLGVSGTVLGAALASVLSAVGNAVYTRSLRSTRDRVRAVVPAGRWARDATDPHPHPRPSAPDEPPTLPSRGPRPTPSPQVGRTPWKGIAIGSIGVFLVVLAGVTVVEVAAGRPLADVVRGDHGTGTSLFGDTAGNSNPRPAVPAVTQTVTPSVVVTTPKVTQTAPAPRTVTVTPTGTATTTTAPSSAPSTSASKPASTSSSATRGTTAPTLG